jgi:hypothetical protein
MPRPATAQIDLAQMAAAFAEQVSEQARPAHSLLVRSRSSAPVTQTLARASMR